MKWTSLEEAWEEATPLSRETEFLVDVMRAYWRMEMDRMEWIAQGAPWPPLWEEWRK